MGPNFQFLGPNTQCGTNSDPCRVSLDSIWLPRSCRICIFERQFCCISINFAEVCHREKNRYWICNDIRLALGASFKQIILEFSGCRNITATSSVMTRGAAEPSNLSVTYLDLSDCSNVTDKSLEHTAINCSNLSHLYLRRCTKITGTTWIFIFLALTRRIRPLCDKIF